MVEAIVALVGVVGGSVVWVAARLDQRNKRTLLERDLELIEKAKDHPRVQRHLVDLAAQEARVLAQKALQPDQLRDMLITSRWFAVSGAVGIVVWLLELVIFGEVPWTVEAPRGKWVPVEVAQAANSILAMAGLSFVLGVLAWLFSLLMFRRWLRSRRNTTDRPTRPEPSQ